MASTVIRGAQIKDSTVQRHDLDTSTVGQAVVTKIVQGTGVTLSSTGADSGTGDVTVAASAIPLASSSASGLMNQTSGNSTDFIDGTNNSQPLQPVIWSVRLRSYNAVQNSTFEVDQRNIGIALVNPVSGTFIQDRWQINKIGTMGIDAGQSDGSGSALFVPGTNFRISSKWLGCILRTQQTTLGAGDIWLYIQNLEGPVLRELISDVSSISLLVLSSVAGLKFSVALRDPGSTTKSLVKLCTIPSANTLTLITLPNLPVFPSGNFSLNPGAVGYTLSITLACGTTYIAPAADTFQAGNFVGAPGMSNFAAQPINSTFYLAFVQHEPGAVCTTPIDCPFTGPNGNLEACQRYFVKSYDYPTKPGTVTVNGCINFFAQASQNPLIPIRFPRVMAKPPTTITAYSTVTGALGTVRDYTAGLDKSQNSSINPGDSGFDGIAIGSPNAAIWNAAFHYTADTGW